MRTIIGFFAIILVWFDLASAQETPFFWGDEKRLEIIVHIWGEVKKPGGYRVPDNTNLLQLISLAGGPNEFSNLSKVRLTRMEMDSAFFDSLGLHQANSISHYKKKIIELNIKQYLNNPATINEIPILKPGDVVYISRNKWFFWKNVVEIGRDLGFLAYAIFWIQRAF